MNKKILYMLMCSSALLVTGCGSDKNNTDTANNYPNPATSTAQVTFADTVPAQTKTKIKEIVSPVGTSLVSSNHISTTQKETLVTALDEKGEIRLAGITTATQPLQLNAESTAIALVRLAIQVPKDVLMSDINQKIKTTDEFAKLTRLIQTSLDKGELATDSEDVLVSILTVTQQVITALKTATATKSLAQARALPIKPAVESPFPFYLIDNATSSVTINQSGQLINNMPIAWSARSTTYLGKPIISADSDANGNIAIPPANFFNRTGNAVKDMTIFGALLNYFLANNITIPSDNNKSFELTLEQTEQTRKANIYDVYNRMILGVLDIASKNNDTKCGAAIGKTLLQGDKFKDFAVSENPDDGMAWLNDTSSANLLAYIQNSTTVANGCADTVELKSMIKIAKTNFSFQYKLFKAGLKVFNKVNPILTASEYASITEKSWFVYKYWNGDENGKKVVRTVCMGSSLLGSPVISNCANNFERKDNNEIVATFGAKIPLGDLAIIAKDRNDKETLIPNSIEYKTDTPDLLKINKDSDGKVTLETLGKLGEASLTVFDSTTNVKNEKPINISIVEAKLNPSSAKIKKGDSFTFNLQDNKGRKIKYNGNTYWESLNPEIARLVLFNEETKGSSLTVQGVSKGTTDIVANNTTWGNWFGAKVEVIEEEDYYFDVGQRVINFNGDNIIQFYYITNGKNYFLNEICVRETQYYVYKDSGYIQEYDSGYTCNSPSPYRIDDNYIFAAGDAEVKYTFQFDVTLPNGEKVSRYISN